MPASASTPSGAYAEVWHPKSRATIPLDRHNRLLAGLQDERLRRTDGDGSLRLVDPLLEQLH
eukprot:5289648-Alexandrium_andersonii.AAC.1